MICEAGPQMTDDSDMPNFSPLVLSLTNSQKINQNLISI